MLIIAMHWGRQSTRQVLSPRHCNGSIIVVIAAIGHGPQPDCLSSYGLPGAQTECSCNDWVQSTSRIQLPSLGDTAIPQFAKERLKRKHSLLFLKLHHNKGFLVNGVACEYTCAPLVTVS